jgi:glutathione peroxidase
MGNFRAFAASDWLNERGVVMQFFLIIFLVFGIWLPANEESQSVNVHAFSLQDIDGNEVDLADYSGQVLMLVNVASECGYTYQYEGLQALYEEYRERGFTVLAFPANNFGGQEPGTHAEIKAFCSGTFGVTFPIFGKISVKGDDIHPLYQYLTMGEHDFTGGISWNFNKFVINKRGEIVARFASSVDPQAEEVLSTLEANL